MCRACHTSDPPQYVRTQGRRRRYACPVCGHRWWTTEVEEVELERLRDVEALVKRLAEQAVGAMG